MAKKPTRKPVNWVLLYWDDTDTQDSIVSSGTSTVTDPSFDLMPLMEHITETCQEEIRGLAQEMGWDSPPDEIDGIRFMLVWETGGRTGSGLVSINGEQEIKYEVVLAKDKK